MQDIRGERRLELSGGPPGIRERFLDFSVEDLGNLWTLLFCIFWMSWLAAVWRIVLLLGPAGPHNFDMFKYVFAFSVN